MKQIVYKIKPKCEHNEEDVYFGSTHHILNQRWSKHKSSYKRWKNGKGNKVYSFILFDKYGIENCEIIALEEFENLTSEALKEKEALFIISFKCVNKNIPNNFKNNPNYQIDYFKEYYTNNKEEHLKYLKEYYIDNKEHLTILSKEKFVCECGGEYIRANKARHFKTKKHQEYLNDINFLVV